MAESLRRTITVGQGVALYVGAIVGAGVLLLPGLSATEAGPVAIVAWIFDATLGIPLALTLASLASRCPNAGGVATYVTEAFGPAAGAVVGWFYFIGAATAQTLVALTGAYYGATYMGLSREFTFLVAGLILLVATLSNLRGIKVSGRLQLVFAGTVALLLLLAMLVSIPRFSADNWTPFAPHGVGRVGEVAVLIFFAFFGWEAITHLAEEFRDPVRDVPRSTLISVGIITVLYVGVVVATIGTGTYGDDETNNTVIARLLADGAGGAVGVVTAVIAVLIALGTANAFVAATSRLGYALARDGAFPAPLARISTNGVPAISVVAVGGYAGLGVVVSYVAGWGPETLLVVPASLVIMTFLAGMAAGVRLLSGGRRTLAGLGTVLCLVLVPFSGGIVVIPVAVTVLALAYRWWTGRRAEPRPEPDATPPAGQETDEDLPVGTTPQE
ncbi:APC family permease [Streptomyces sp. DSM 40750]|uniref:APC family permease n=1 Tax=Streptomyces sp. DSM 40750 TaxID=2801030 RepID=UPI00214C76C6|nr:amino acid permease [Streptomyces sp. DSM 40750]UUU25917.1 amino acid permease [Streptomyces sp. DSM 40750]